MDATRPTRADAPAQPAGASVVPGQLELWPELITPADVDAAADDLHRNRPTVESVVETVLREQGYRKRRGGFWSRPA